jgi:hypothetical protein
MNFDLDLQHYKYIETNNNTNRGSRRTPTINKGGRRCRCVGHLVGRGCRGVLSLAQRWQGRRRLSEGGGGEAPQVRTMAVCTGDKAGRLRR